MKTWCQEYCKVAGFCYLVCLIIPLLMLVAVLFGGTILLFA
jgi:hypothetical protein